MIDPINKYVCRIFSKGSIKFLKKSQRLGKNKKSSSIFMYLTSDLFFNSKLNFDDVYLYIFNNKPIFFL